MGVIGEWVGVYNTKVAENMLRYRWSLLAAILRIAHSLVEQFLHSKVNHLVVLFVDVLVYEEHERQYW